MESSRGFDSGPSRPLTRTLTTGNLQDVKDPEVVPSSLSSIAPILRVANEIEEKAPRVAYLCRFYAFDKAHKIDPSSSGRGVRQFKTALLHKLEKDDNETLKARSAKSDAREMQNFYQQFYTTYVESLENSAGDNVDRAQLARTYQTAAVLFDVLRAVNQQSQEMVDKDVMDKAEEVKFKTEIYVPYNILPLDPGGNTQAIIMLPEVSAALAAIRNTRGLEFGPAKPNSQEYDVLEWLQITYGFQKDNVANQREHLILLLANVHIRQIPKPNPQDKLSDAALDSVMKRLFKNYRSWCKFLGRKSSIESPSLQQELQQRKILYISLFLLIWGEAANLRFMPESLCYIFHHMASELNGMVAGKVSSVTGENIKPAYGGEPDIFLNKVVTPLYNIIAAEVSNNNRGTARHSAWRNYDDLNEYFWSVDCFRLGWPMRPEADFFKPPRAKTNHRQVQGRFVGNKRASWIGKTNFVEVRSFWHVFRSFDRMWSFFILALQAMVIIAWNGSLKEIFHEHIRKRVLSVFITAAILRLIQAIVDIGLNLKAWRSMRLTNMLRYILKVVVAAGWVVVLPVCYARTYSDIAFVSNFKDLLGGAGGGRSLFLTAILVYLAPDALGLIMFLLPPLRRRIERSNNVFMRLLLWWAQPPLFIGRGMHEDFYTLFKYTLFWVLLLVSKLLFSFYVEIMPLVGPTKEIIQAPTGNYHWHELFPRGNYNIGVVIALWSPIILVYFMDAQIWYAIWSTIFGGIHGAFSRLGEIRTLAMLRSRFLSLPGAFNDNLVPPTSEEKPRRKGFTLHKTYKRLDEGFKPAQEVERTPDGVEMSAINEKDAAEPQVQIAKFSQLWNAIIESFREEDYIDNKERELLLIPYNSDPTMKYMQWPPFLLANKIALALDIAQDFTDSKTDEELIKRVNDTYMKGAIEECYDLLVVILRIIVKGKHECKVVENIIKDVQDNIMGKTLLKAFRMTALPLLYDKVVELVDILKDSDPGKTERVTYLLQDILEVYTRDVKKENNLDIPEASHHHHWGDLKSSEGRVDNVSVENTQPQLFERKSIDYPPPESLIEKIQRLHLLLTITESALDIPVNLEARRRIAFFTNSLFMEMPPPPKIRNMLSFSVLTPYYNEDVLFTRKGLEEENEDGVSILFYLQKIYPDEWKNFKERMDCTDMNLWDNDKTADAVRQWASYRSQTLTRTVRGMMYYRRALQLQAFFDMAAPADVIQGYKAAVKDASTDKNQRSLPATIEAVTDMKFSYVVSCQQYGHHKRIKASQANDIGNLLKEYPSLRVAYIDEVEEGKKKEYYSILVKALISKEEESAVTEQVVYKIKLPGQPILGEGKPENQNHAIIFTRGEALQAIDMNQDNYLEEALKMRNLLQEFLEHGKRAPTIVGMRENIFTGSVSSLAGFMSNQESSFVTIGQRVLANPLKVRFHYGHPDLFERLFHITSGGISKASKLVNLSEDIFAGFNTTLRGGNVTHHEYIQVGKGRDVGLNQISMFEAKIANGNGEQTMSRDLYRLGHRMDFFRMLSVYFTTVGFYFSTLIVVITAYVFLYGRIYLALSGLETSLELFASLSNNTPLQAALASQSFVQIGLVTALPMVMEIGLERGFRMALSEFIVMQLQLASVFFTFSMGTKVHFYGRTLLHGGSKYRSTGRGFVVFHAKFAENYRLYSRSHFTKGLELLILLIVYNVYGTTVHKTVPYLLITISLWFLVGTWLFAPFLFNPSGFEWQKIVDDWDDWNKWISNRGGIGVPADKSWESWWEDEQAHLNSSGFWGQLIEVILSARFLLYQYGLVYHLHISQGSTDILVYALSWLVIIVVLGIIKVVSMGRQRFSADYQLLFRLLKVILFIAAIATISVLFVVTNLSIGDLFTGALAFLPTGWALVQICQACRSAVKRIGMWESLKSLARGYEYLMGLVLLTPIAILAWFPFISDFQTRLLFNQAFSRGLQISRILAGRKEKKMN
ncbi:hypothetical protein GOP47_0012298 [Adiantum capillus-veneris]|uniref:1,3-beta-glucan synthase n=1 Tax=Adiantum capillus-veneris TaxID=13818 RepID=A0A9D4URG5_ADICA|nr:hypothetical protein GOP47_0012298 [Adiantum capillus-veneris]